MQDVFQAKLDRAAGKYLTFRLGSEIYGIEILRVQEIIGVMPSTRVPGTPRFVRGVLNLRGKVIPIADIRRKFDMDEQDTTERSCYIVTQIGTEDDPVLVGMMVDEVSEVIQAQPGKIEITPELGIQIPAECFFGIAHVGEESVLLLDIAQALPLESFVEMQD